MKEKTEHSTSNTGTSASCTYTGELKLTDQKNKGTNMMTMMGWKGGGLGREGQGIIEPITLLDVYGREGLGSRLENRCSRKFQRTISQFLEDYMNSSKIESLVMSPMFNKTERSTIFKIGSQLGLKCQTKKEGNKCFMVITRKMTANELYKLLLEHGGETNRYKILEPGTVFDLIKSVDQKKLAAQRAAIQEKINKNELQDRNLKGKIRMSASQSLASDQARGELLVGPGHASGGGQSQGMTSRGKPSRFGATGGGGGWRGRGGGGGGGGWGGSTYRLGGSGRGAGGGGRGGAGGGRGNTFTHPDIQSSFLMGNVMGGGAAGGW